MVTHAPEPLCNACGEDRPSMVEPTKDKGRVVMHCSTCGKSWHPAVNDVNGMNGILMEGGEIG